MDNNDEEFRKQERGEKTRKKRAGCVSRLLVDTFLEA